MDRLKIFRKGLMPKIPIDKRVIADQGYVGEPQKASTRNEFDSAEVIEIKHRAKARQETVNARIKAFGILNQVFRTTGKQRLKKHKAVFRLGQIQGQLYSFKERDQERPGPSRK